MGTQRTLQTLSDAFLTFTHFDHQRRPLHAAMHICSIVSVLMRHYLRKTRIIVVLTYDVSLALTNMS